MARTSRKITTDTPTVPKETVFKTAIYVRLSKEDFRDKDNNSIESQTELIKQFIKERPYLSVVDTYCDNGTTGTNFEREQFIRMMEDIKSGKINCLVVKDLSRFGRSYLEVGNYLEKIFPFLGVRFISVTDNFDNFDPQNTGESLIIALKSLMHDIYAKDISVKIKSVYQTRQKNGEFMGAYPPYGYLRDEQNKNKLVVDDFAAPIVQNIFEWHTDGLQCFEIAQKLNDSNVLTPLKYFIDSGVVNFAKRTPKPFWDGLCVKRILTNPMYLGHMVQGKTQTNHSQPSKTRTPKPENEWFVKQDTHPALIDVLTFEQANQRLNKISEKYKDINHDPRTDNVLSKLIVCGDCGRLASRNSHTLTNGHEVQKYYCRLCKKWANNGKTYAIAKESEIIDVVFNAIKSQLVFCADMVKVAKNMEVSKENKSRQKQLHGEITLLKQRLTKTATLSSSLYDDFADGLLDQAEYAFAKKKYEDDKAIFQRRLDEIFQEQKKSNGLFVLENDYLQTLQQFQNATELTQEMAHTLIEKVELYHDKSVNIHFKHQDEFAELLTFSKDCEVR